MRLAAVMIAKNESAIIRESVLALRATGLFHSVYVMDTGSTDDTRELAADAGAIVRSVAWEGFGESRTRALAVAGELAGDGYLLMLDVDDRIFGATVADGWRNKLPGPLSGEFGLDGYVLDVFHNGVAMRRPHVFRIGAGWTYKGALHEYAHAPEGARIGHLTGITCVCNVVPSARDSNPYKYRDDAEILAEEYESSTDPGVRARAAFYAARSWYDYAKACEEPERKCSLEFALAWFFERASMSESFEEERWYAALMIARILDALDEDPCGAYMRAYADRPWRAEPLYYLAGHLRVNGQPHAARMVALEACRAATDDTKAVQRTGDVLFIEQGCYAYGCHDEASLALHQTGDHEGAIAIAAALLKVEGLPETDRARIQTNLTWFKRGLAK